MRLQPEALWPFIKRQLGVERAVWKVFATGLNMGEERRCLGSASPVPYGAESRTIMVFVLDKHQNPLMPCSEKRARQLLDRGRARVHTMFPFTIRLVDRRQEDSAFQDLRVKLDPGSKTTGVAITLDGARGTPGIFLGEIVHKPGIQAKLADRRTVRRSRRFRHTRYRAARFLNRRRKADWLPPSLEARVDQTLHAVAKIRTRAPITALSVEHVRFDHMVLLTRRTPSFSYGGQ